MEIALNSSAVCRGEGKKTSQAQRAATSRYRERNKAELQRKARERMANHRAKLKQSKDGWAAYAAKAREDAARYRALNAEALAMNQAARRAKRSIAKQGFAAWHDSYMKRHPCPPQPEEDLPEWPSSSDESDTDRDAIPPPPPESASYEEHLNYFLDYKDPTTVPGYVPKPGQQPFFQRGKERWH